MALPLAPMSLIAAATVWGLVWYPYRVLQADGLGGATASLLTYALGLPLLFWLMRRRGEPLVNAQWPWLLAVALTAGWTNLAYVLAVIQGEVMRVLLLFYLAPLWTVLFAHLFLRERAGVRGLAVIVLALCGAIIMLGGFEHGVPLPETAAEWLGLSSGMGFALSNVLTRRLRDVPIATRSFWVFLGVVGLSVVFAAGELDAAAVHAAQDAARWLLLGGITLALLLATFTVQYGLAHVAANRAIVILLSELVVAAISSHWLADEAMGLREWLGGALIVAATLFSVSGDKHA